MKELTEGLADKFDFEILCGPPLVVTGKTDVPSPFPLPAGERVGVRGVKVHQVPTLKLPKQILFARVFNDLSFLIFAFLRGLFIATPDLVVSQTSPPGIWWVACALSFWYGRKWIHISKDTFPENLRVLARGKYGKLFSVLEHFNKLVLDQAEKILVIGDDMKEIFLAKGFPSKKIIRTSDWVDLNFIHPMPKKNPFSKKYGLDQKFVVLYAGNFGRIYNFEDLFAVAGKFLSSSDVLFVLVGEGAMKKELQKEAEFRELHNVRFFPFEERSKLSEVLAAADISIILLAKGMEGLSMPSKIYSILASGRPIIACVEPESDIAKMVQESNAGFVVSPGQPEEFEHSIKNFLENRELLQKAGLNARQFVEQKDFQSRALQDYERVFREVLEGHTLLK